jgi:cytochrome c peroxidase
MKNKLKFILSLFVFTLLVAAYIPNELERVSISYPTSWPDPVYDFNKNPLSKEGVQLGRKLFYDPILSKDNSISCSNCHLSFTAFTHVDHPLSHGIHDSIGTRNSPALMNLAWGKSFMWDGAVNHLDMQALAPISHPAEMGEDIANVVDKIQHSKVYPLLFQKVFNDSIITGEHLLKAIAQFQLTLVSANSKYDKVMAKAAQFTEQEERGYQLFKINCESCHQEPLFTSGDFANNGLTVDSTLMDFGRMIITKNPQDSLLFKIPTLRNIEFSHPYMHDGRFRNLSQVLNHYTKGIHKSSTLAPALQNGVHLNENEKVDIIAFLLTLSDKAFVLNPDFTFPR